MIGNFFDLQRFADNVLVSGGASGFYWQGGDSFGGGAGRAANDPAYLSATGSAKYAGNATNVYLSGNVPYDFQIQGVDGWKVSLGSASSVVRATATGIDQVTGSAVLELQNEFDQTVNGKAVYINGTTNVNVSGNEYSFTDTVEGVDVGIGDNSIIFDKKATQVNLGIGASAAAVSLKGFGFEKGAVVGLGDSGNDIGIIAGDGNTVTVPGDNAWKVNGPLPVIGVDSVGAVTRVVGIDSATLEGAITSTASVGVGGASTTVWDSIAGATGTVVFDSVGNATVNNTGAVTVQGAAGAEVELALVTATGSKAPYVVNTVSLQANSDALSDIGFTLEQGGISVINFPLSGNTDKYLEVYGDTKFDVVSGPARNQTTYSVNATLPTSLNAVEFNATANGIAFNVVSGEDYSVSGGNAQFLYLDGIAAKDSSENVYNGATVGIKNNDSVANSGVAVVSTGGLEGISLITALKPGDSVSVANDGDGYEAIFNAPTVAGNYNYMANGAAVDAYINKDDNQPDIVAMSVGGSGNNVTVTGLYNTSVTIPAGTGYTYTFKDTNSIANVIEASSEDIYVTINGDGNVTDHRTASEAQKLGVDDEKWQNIATVGGAKDTVEAHHSNALDQFYALAQANSVASYVSDNDSVPGTVANAAGYTYYGATNGLPADLNIARHVSLVAGTAVGGEPIQIQKDENAYLYSATIDLTRSNSPSTVAIGTTGTVAASHRVSLSNAGTGYAYIGADATGQNAVTAGTGGAEIRHDGDSRATIQGNSGRDTIWAAKDDIVTGGAGADDYYDRARYTIKDYNAFEGDRIIATRIASTDAINKTTIVQGTTGNQISFGSNPTQLTLGTNPDSSLYVKVGVMDSDARVVATKNVILAGVNGGAVDASAVDADALIIADSYRNGNSGDIVLGSAFADEIFVGANDYVDSGAGDDVINIESITAGDAGAQVLLGAGNDTVKGWTFGFDQNQGATKLISSTPVIGRFYNDRLMVYNDTGSILFDGTEKTATHGQNNVLVEENGVEKKFLTIRTFDENTTNVDSYGVVNSNDEIADYYLAERDGQLIFTGGVTNDLGLILLQSDQYQNIRELYLANNSKASVIGSSDRETVALGGYATEGSNKAVSLGGGNDVIVSGGDGTVGAGHKIFFGSNDGRDTIYGFSHDLGSALDPDKQYADVLVLEDYTGLKVERSAGGDRIEIGTGEESRVVLYETGDNAVNVNNKYRMQIGFGPENIKVAKIGFSDAANNFTYEKGVSYYVGNSGETPNDTLTIADTSENVEIFLDGSRNGGEFYRGITNIDASAEVDTNLSLVGGVKDDEITAGGVGTRNFMWGGTGDDILNGGLGTDYFLYYQNSGAYIQGANASDNGGNDTVNGYSFDDDVIWMGDVTLADLKSAEISATGVVLELNNGGSLTVNHNGDNTRVFLNNGTEAYVADRTTGTWTREF